MSDSAQSEEAVFTAALKLAAGQRDAYLQTVCGGDAQLRARVEGLLQSMGQPVDSDKTRVISVPLTERPGDKIGRYKLLQQIGEGGCGVVYMADQEEPVKRRVALKVIKPGMDTKEVLGRFEAERQALALMDHPNISKVLDAGATETGRPFFVMELVRGVPITRYCDEHKLNTEQRLELFIQVCQAIQHAHQKGIIHRDIKPSNILVADHDGVPVPKIIDFGIAKATAGQPLTDKTVFTALEQFIGTPAYMSPEQANLSGLDIDTRSDIYSLGVLLYELLTGKTPFEARRLIEVGFDEIRRIIRDEEPQRPSQKLSTLAAEEQTTTANSRQTDSPRLIHLVRGDLDWIVMKCLEKDRNRRYETASGLASDLQRHIKNEPVLACPPSNVYRFQKMVRRNKLGCAAATAVALALVLGALVSTWQARRAVRAEQHEAALREKAEAAEKTAVSEAKRAGEAREQTLREKRLAEHASYVSSIGLADRFINELRYDDALRLLDACPLEYRAWEWNRLSFLCHLGSVTFAGHSNQVWSIAFSPEGGEAATAGFDGKVRVWDTRTGAQRQTAAEFNTNAACVAYSPDGRFLAAGSYDGTGGIWETRHWQPVARLVKHDERIFSIAYSMDGAMIATGGGSFQDSRDNSIRLWNARNGNPIARLQGHQGCVYCARFEPGGARLASCGKDGVKIWNLHSLTQEKQLSQSGSYTLCYTPDGHYLAFTRGTAIVLLDLRSGKETLLDTDDAVWSLAISSDGRRLAAGLDDRTALLVDLPSMRLVSTLKGHSARVVSVAFSPDGKEVGTTSTDGLAKIWRCTEVPDRRVMAAHSGLVLSLAYSSDGRWLASAGADGSCKLWDLESQRVLQTWTAGDSPAVSVDLSPKGNVTAGDARDAAPPVSVAFCQNGSRLALGLGNAAIVWDLSRKRELARVSESNDLVGDVALSADGHWLLTIGWLQQARLWNAESGEQICTLGEAGTVMTSAAFRPLANELAVGCAPPKAGVIFWNPENCQRIRLVEGHQRAVSSVVYSPHGDLFASGGWDGVINILDAASARPVSSIRGLPWTPVVIAFSPDSRRLASAAGRRFIGLAGRVASGATLNSGHDRVSELRIWEANTGIDLLSLTGRTAPVCAAFSPDGNTLASGGEDGSITLWLTQADQP